MKLVAIALLLSTQNVYAIVNGLDISVQDHPEVKKLMIGRGGVCSGTFIGPHTMITAAHCLRLAGAKTKGSDGDDLNLKVDGVQPTKYRINPKSVLDQNGKYPYSEDIAVLEFPSDKKFAANVVATASPAVGERVELVGFGLSKRSDPSTVGIKRKGANVVKDSMFGQLLVEWVADDYPIRAVGLPGDSGGPLLNANGELIGVANEASGENMKKGGRTWYMGAYVDVNEPEIKAFLRKAVKDLGGDAPSLFKNGTGGGAATQPSAHTPAK